MNETNKVFEVGGKETYTYEEMAKMCFESAGKEVVIKYVPKFMFSILANLPGLKHNHKTSAKKTNVYTNIHNVVLAPVTLLFDKCFIKPKRRKTII